MAEEQMNIVLVLEKLIGPIDAAGCSVTDRKRLVNMDTHIEAANHLIYELFQASKNESRQESSMHEVGQKARKAMDGIFEYFRQFGEMEELQERTEALEGILQELRESLLIPKATEEKIDELLTNRGGE